MKLGMAWSRDARVLVAVALVMGRTGAVRALASIQEYRKPKSKDETLSSLLHALNLCRHVGYRLPHLLGKTMF